MWNGMVVLIDTNVIIDFLLKREPFREPAAIILQKCAEKELDGYLAFHFIPTYLVHSAEYSREQKKRIVERYMQHFLCNGSQLRGSI